MPNSLITNKRGEIIITKAETLLEEVHNKNELDLFKLWNFLDNNNSDKSTTTTNFNNLKIKTINKLKDDKVAFKTLKESIGSDGDFWPLSTSLTKLIGQQQQQPSSSRSYNNGILDDAISSLESTSTLEDLKIKINNTTISGNQITVLKTALIYLAFLTGKWKWDREGRVLDLIYPASFGTLSSQQKSIALKTVLCQNHNNKDKVILYQPNSGYVFGGNFFGTICRGLDCSSFVSYCVDSSARLGTWHMKLIYEKLLNNENKDVNDAVVEKTFSEFEAIEIRENIDNTIQKGDIVIWRGSSGHTAIFKEWISKSKQTFLGIDNNRMDDKSREGIGFTTFQLYKDNRKTFVLRKK